MRRPIWTRALALLLVFFLLAPDVAAATNRGYETMSRRNPWVSLWEDFWGKFWGDKDEEPEETQAPTEETQAPTEETPVITPADPETDLTLVEGASTVDNPELLRASTFALTRDASETTTTTKVVYFPVTMYNYDQDTINAATDKLDNDLTVREGLYFSDGGSEVPSTVTTSASMAPGEYYIQNIRANANGVDCWLQAHEDKKIYAVAQADATVWTLQIEDGEYYLTCELDGTTYYMLVGTDGDTDGYTTTKTPIEIVAYSGNAEGVQLRQNGHYLCQWGGATELDFGGYKENNDDGNGMRFYAVTDDGISDTPTTLTPGESYVSAGYEAWNRWGYNSDGHASQNKAYTGLVQNTLINDQIKFNVNEPGIFDDNAEIKDIYYYVGLPFVLDTDSGVYSFCSDNNGVYFADTNGDGTSDPKSGTADAPYNLYFDAGNTQGWDGMYYGDGSSNLWAPFNTNANDTGAGAIDYHFGMRADIPFSMTANGRVKSTDDESTPITFSFQGDDDVWVFIDGHLVIDLGGIHNRLGATIDFAANTITYFLPGSNNKKDLPIGSHNDPDFQLTQKLFTDSEGEGVIPMSREAFALDPDHEMQVFYLERGEGTSNARIEFNLPMHDTVIVTKDATKSWSQAGENADLEENPGAEDPGVDQLTAAEQAIVNNIDFGFTLYKKTAGSDEFEPVANTNFYLIGRAVEGVVINSTDANGHFYLKNGQSAKFITEIPMDGVTYYVVEDKVPDGFISPDFNFAGEAVYAYTYTDGTTTGTTPAGNADEIPEQIIPMPTENEDGTLTWAENKSYEVTVRGSIEANDSIEFICSNYLDAELPNPTALAYEDIIVIDYGLPVIIDPLANDVFRGENIEIVYYGNDSVTLTETTGVDGIVTGTYSGEKNFHSGSVVLNDKAYSVADDGTVTRDTFTYTLNKQLTEVEVITYIIKVTGQEEQNATHETLTQYDYAIGKVYIVPATVMYYEENFNGLVTFTGSNWKNAVTTSGASDHQEPGVVGTTTDSIYGSDVAYLNDSFDSNGSSYYGNTTNGAIRFQYTFTGTGTTVFARTSATTGYVQFKLYEGTDTSGEYIGIYYRDTYWKDEIGITEDAGGTLYNIPIYTQEDLAYGTYTVVATVAKKGTPTDGNVAGSGNEFYLDGIRIMQPLNEVILEEAEYDEDGNMTKEPVYDAITTKARGAYATDGESNIDTVTLRYKLITDHEQEVDPEAGEEETEWPFAVMTDVDGEIVYASDYVSIGPKEEVYLLPGQSVSFSIKYWHPDGYRMHMGMKAPFGNAAVKVGQTTFALNNTVDCYYDITGLQASVVNETDEKGNTYYVATYTFTATDKIVSLTNIKIVGNYEFVLVKNTNIDVSGGGTGTEETVPEETTGEENTNG